MRPQPGDAQTILQTGRDLQPAAGPQGGGAGLEAVPRSRPRQLRGPGPARQPVSRPGRFREGGGRAAEGPRAESRPRRRPTRASAEIYAGADQTDQAILHFRKALEIEPGAVRTRLRLGEVLFRARRYPEALDEATNVVLAPTPRTRCALDLQGRSLRETRDFDGAAEGRRGASRPAPRRPGGPLPEGHGRRGPARFRRGRHDPRGDPRPQPSSRGRERQERPDLPGPPGRRLPAARALRRRRRGLRPRRRPWEATPTPRSSAIASTRLVLAKDFDKALVEVRAARAKFPEDTDLAAVRGHDPALEGGRRRRPQDHRRPPAEVPGRPGRAAAGGRVLPAGQAPRRRRVDAAEGPRAGSQEPPDAVPAGRCRSSARSGSTTPKASSGRPSRSSPTRRPS